MSFLDRFGNDEAKKRKSHLKNLMLVAFSDGEMDMKEAMVIEKIGQRLQIPREEVKEVMENHNNVKFYSPDDPKERYEQMFDLVQIMMADGRIDSQEMKLCKDFAMKAGYEKPQVDNLLDHLQGAVRNDQSPSQSYSSWEGK